MGRNDGLTQALAVAAAGIVMLIIDTICLGPIVDTFIYYASTWAPQLVVFKQQMQAFVVFGQWFYYIIFVLGLIFLAYPIIFVIKRHRYMDVEPVSDEAVFQQ